MDIKTILKFAFLVFGIANLIFGLALISSKKFFTFWQNRYWKQENNAHEKKETVSYNRYTRGFFHLAIGLIFTYFAVYSL